ncbi:MAG: adenylate/guanylate cyclase domain-containing protein [Candidatus Binatus sp.]
MQPQTKYAKSGDIHIAYSTVGDGPRDLLIVPGLSSHLDIVWEEPSLAAALKRLSSFARVIMFDRRGQGLSDRVGGAGTIEEEIDDARAVMDAVGSERATLLGLSEGGLICALFSASFPERTAALILYGSFAATPWGPSDSEQWEQFLSYIEAHWGDGSDVSHYAPSRANDESFKQYFARFQRAAASPSAVLALLRRIREVDIRPLLPSIHVPTLILHRTGDQAVSVESGRYMSERIPGAKFVEFPSNDHCPIDPGQGLMLDEIEEFVTGVRHRDEPDRVLATVMFTDIVGSTERAAQLGDHRWAELLQSYYLLARKELTAFRGREVNTTGDGMLATFDGPARAIRCACAVRHGVRSLGLQVRAGLHTGECELMGDDVGGIAVHIGARVAGIAAPDEVLVSSTVKDLVAGSGISFKDRGTHELKGVPDTWRLFQVGDS